MRISAYDDKNCYTSFKASFPVMHTIAEAGGNYVPVSNLKMVQYFQDKLITYLNSHLCTPAEMGSIAKKKTSKSVSKLKEPLNESAQMLRSYVGIWDVDYRTTPKVRSFYNRSRGESFPISYIISGKDVKLFDEKFAKNIGIQRRLAHGIMTPELSEAIRNYYNGGLSFVNSYVRRIKSLAGLTQILQTRFEIVRDVEGKFVGYKFVDAKFLPEIGADSPFAKMGLKAK